jgi:hypothetical protein
VAHAVSSERGSGRQTNTRSRLGVSPAPAALNGPVRITSSMCGRPEKSMVSDELRTYDWSRRVLRACVFWRNATEMSRGPALSGTRTVNRPSTLSPVVVGLSLEAAISSLPPNDARCTRRPSTAISSWCGYSRPRIVPRFVRNSFTWNWYSPSSGRVV